MGVSVLIPTRDRPKRFRLAAETALKFAKGKVEVIAYVDDDDPQLKAYEEIEIPNVRVMVGPRMGLARIIHRLIESSLYSYMFLGADDIEFQSTGWDLKMSEKIPDDCIGLVWCDDKWKQTCNHFMFHQKWVSLTGFFPDDFEHWGPDTYVKSVSDALKRSFYLDDVTIIHRHYKNNKAKMDDTYSECRAGGMLDRDKKRLENYEHRIKRDIEVLREYI